MELGYTPDDMRARVTALIDGELRDAQERARAEQELSEHPHLQRQHTVESALVAMLHVRRDRLRAALPPTVERRIRMALVSEATPAPSFMDRIAMVLRRPLVALPILAGVTAVVVTIVVTNGGGQTGASAPTSTVAAMPIDLPVQSYSNYQAVVSGTLKLAKETSDPAELKAYFVSQGVTYDVVFPTLEADLKGGVVSEHNGRKYAHLVYAAGEHVVYMFEVDQESIDSKQVELGSRVSDGLAYSRWHWEERADTGTLFVWKSNNVVCLAVSDLRTEELSALFSLEDV